jgi:hypothetical protein
MRGKKRAVTAMVDPTRDHKGCLQHPGARRRRGPPRAIGGLGCTQPSTGAPSLRPIVAPLHRFRRSCGRCASEPIRHTSSRPAASDVNQPAASRQQPEPEPEPFSSSPDAPRPRGAISCAEMCFPPDRGGRTDERYGSQAPTSRCRRCAWRRLRTSRGQPRGPRPARRADRARRPSGSPFGTAHERSTPSSSRRKVEVVPRPIVLMEDEHGSVAHAGRKGSARDARLDQSEGQACLASRSSRGTRGERRSREPRAGAGIGSRPASASSCCHRSRSTVGTTPTA